MPGGSWPAPGGVAALELRWPAEGGPAPAPGARRAAARCRRRPWRSWCAARRGARPAPPQRRPAQRRPPPRRAARKRPACSRPQRRGWPQTGPGRSAAAAWRAPQQPAPGRCSPAGQRGRRQDAGRGCGAPAGQAGWRTQHGKWHPVGSAAEVAPQPPTWLAAMSSCTAGAPAPACGAAASPRPSCASILASAAAAWAVAASPPPSAASRAAAMARTVPSPRIRLPGMAGQASMERSCAVA